MKNENIKQAIIEWFENHEEFYNSTIEELDSWNGYLGDDRYYEMEELDELYCDVEPSEILRRAFYGYDAETWTLDQHGDKHYGAFNPNRYYFSYNGYGNLVSYDYKDYSTYLDEYFIDEVADNIEHIDIIAEGSTEEAEEVAILFNKYNGFDKDLRVL